MLEGLPVPLDDFELAKHSKPFVSAAGLLEVALEQLRLLDSGR